MFGSGLSLTWWEDALKGRSLAVTSLGFSTLAPLGMPSQCKRWVSVLAAGMKLYLETSGEADTELKDHFVEFALT